LQRFQQSQGFQAPRRYTNVVHGSMDLSSKQYLQKRGDAWSFRRRVPPELVAHIGKTEWKRALPADLRSAQVFRNALAAQTDREIAAARAMLAKRPSPALSPADAVRLAQEWVARTLESDQEWRLLRGRAWAANVDIDLEENVSVHREELAHMEITAVSSIAETWLSAKGLWYPPEDASRTLLQVELLKARVVLDDLMQRRQSGEVVESPQVTEAAPVGPSGSTVADLIATYRAAREADHGEESTSRKYNHVFKALEEALGTDARVANITRADCRAVHDLLRRLPLRVSRAFPGMALQEAADANAAIGGPVIAPTTVSTYMENLSALLNFAVAEGWLTSNPAAGLRQRGAPQTRRRGYTPKELTAVFAGLTRWRDVMPWRFWVPALALYTGARAGELCQLLGTDVVVEEEGAFIDLSPFDARGVRTEKRLKTASSQRQIPLHPELITAGFLRFVESRPERSGRLFPELPRGRNGGYSHALSRWWGRHLDSIGFRDPSLTFHGFRHGFADAGRLAGLTAETVEALGGWSSRGQRSRYGDRMALARDIKRIGYGNFRLPASE